MVDQPIASDLSYAVLLKQRREPADAPRRPRAHGLALTGSRSDALAEALGHYLPLKDDSGDELRGIRHEAR